jgi:hypothetical protein
MECWKCDALEDGNSKDQPLFHKSFFPLRHACGVVAQRAKPHALLALLSLKGEEGSRAPFINTLICRLIPGVSEMPPLISHDSQQRPLTCSGRPLSRSLGYAKMTGTKIPKTLIRLILKWMNNKKTGSLQINFIKGEIDSAFLNFAVSLKNNEDRKQP